LWRRTFISNFETISSAMSSTGTPILPLTIRLWICCIFFGIIFAEGTVLITPVSTVIS
jgi:hypothetical protein